MFEFGNEAGRLPSDPLSQAPVVTTALPVEAGPGVTNSAVTTAPAAAADQWIDGVDNKIVLAGAAVLGLFAFMSMSKK